MTKIRSTDSSRIQDARSPARRGQNRTKAANPGLYPKARKGRASQADVAAQLNYTPSPTVKGAKPGSKGGVWTTKGTGRTVGTSASEDSPIKKVRGGRGGGGRKS